MDRPRLIRDLRIAWSVVFGIVCVLLIVLWVRSYRWVDWWQCPIGGNLSLHVQSRRGEISVLHFRGSIQLATGSCSIAGIRLSENPGYAMMITGTPSAMRVVPLPDKQVVSELPHWLFRLIGTLIAATPWLPWHKSSFSLRTLLIATTLVAVVLGLVVWSTAQ
jgi:hypothetical protein